MAAKPTQKRAYQQHGTHTLERALQRFGSEGWLEHLGPDGAALRAWRDALVEDLGGEDAISTQQRALVDMAVRTYLILEHIDRFMLSSNAIVNRRDRKLFPVALQRARYSDSLLKTLQALGLERHTLPPKDLSDFIEVERVRPDT